MALNILAQIVPAVLLVVQSNPVDNLSGAVVLGDPVLGWEVVELSMTNIFMTGMGSALKGSLWKADLILSLNTLWQRSISGT